MTTPRIIVITPDGRENILEIPDVNLGISLMEFLKAAEYNIEASCGGIALCATCHIDVMKKGEALPEANSIELSMLDSLPNSDDSSRLACQIMLKDIPDGTVIQILGTP